MPLNCSWMLRSHIIYALFGLLLCVRKDVTEDIPIILLEDEHWSERARCSSGNMKCSYILGGRVNISNIEIQTFALIIDDKLPYFCVIYFNTRCEETNDDICYCRATNDTHIYELVFNLNLNNVSMDVKVVILMIDKKIDSNHLTLPAMSYVSDLDVWNITSTGQEESNGNSGISIITFISGIVSLIVLTLLSAICFKKKVYIKLFRRIGIGLQDERGNSRQLNDVLELSTHLLGNVVNLFMIANSKDGKSATGNTILGSRIFESSVKTESITKNIRREFTRYDEFTYAVFDGPGFHLSDQDDSSLGIVLKSLEAAFKIAPEGFDVFLLIVRFGTAVIDKRHINELKNILGEDFLQKHGIVVMTYKDAFNKDEDECDSIERWVSEQHGYFKYLVEACQRRIVYFDNRSRDDSVITGQRYALFEMISRVRASNNMQRCKKKNKWERMMLLRRLFTPFQRNSWR